MQDKILKHTLNVVTETGFKSLEAVNYFVYFANNAGHSIVGLTGNQTPEKLKEYQRALRFFKVLAGGTKKEEGLGLFNHDFSCIRLTQKGEEFIAKLNEVQDEVPQKQLV